MSIPDIKYCPGLLTEGYHTYSPAFLRRMFDGKRVSHILRYDSPQYNAADAALFIENRKRISISGVQEKLSLVLHKNELSLAEKGERGTYILKPIPLLVKQKSPPERTLNMNILMRRPEH